MIILVSGQMVLSDKKERFFSQCFLLAKKSEAGKEFYVIKYDILQLMDLPEVDQYVEIEVEDEEPAEPAQPAQPAQPVQPVQPVQPYITSFNSESAESESATASSQSEQAEESTQSAEAAEEPASSADNGKAVDLEKPADLSEPSLPAESAEDQLAESEPSDASEQSTESPEQSVPASESTQSPQPAEPLPVESAEPVEAAKSVESAEPEPSEPVKAEDEAKPKAEERQAKPAVVETKTKSEEPAKTTQRPVRQPMRHEQSVSGRRYERRPYHYPYNRRPVERDDDDFVTVKSRFLNKRNTAVGSSLYVKYHDHSVNRDSLLRVFKVPQRNEAEL